MDRQCEQAFSTLKHRLISSPVLAYPVADKDAGFILDTDASDLGLGAVLTQRQGGVEKVIAMRAMRCHRPNVTVALQDVNY